MFIRFGGGFNNSPVKNSRLRLEEPAADNYPQITPELWIFVKEN